MAIRVMTFDGCPSCEATKALVRRTVRKLHLEADIEAIRIHDEEEARRYGFLGSPTIQIDGRDIEPSRRNGAASFACRIYETPHGISGVPPQSLLLDALREARQGA